LRFKVVVFEIIGFPQKNVEHSSEKNFRQLKIKMGEKLGKVRETENAEN